MAAVKTKAREISPVFQKTAETNTETYKTIDRLIRYWLPALGLEDWKINVDYTGAHHPENQDVLARIIPMWEYQSAHLEFYLLPLAKYDEAYLESVVVHELCHALVCQMRTKKSRTADEERVVTGLAKAFLRTKYDPYKEMPAKTPKKAKK